MPIVSSGQVSVGAIAAEFGGSAPHQLSEYYGKGNCPASGEIQLAADFYGTANTYDIQYLIVAGGGGGAGSADNADGAGGGGAGGYRALTATLTAGGSGMTVTIGAGGSGNGIPWYGGNGASNGGNSSFNSNSASGGGGGGGKRNGNSGGSGGGGGHWRNANTTYSGGGGNTGGYTPAEGASGSNCYTYGSYHPNYGTIRGNGGAGGNLGTSDSTWLNGTSYAEGGQVDNGGGGSANTGDGGHSRYQSYGNGTTGGSGVVIIRYAGSQRGSGGTVTSSGGYTYHQFNSSGTYTP